MVCTGPHAVDIPVFAISANIFVITSFPERSEIFTRESVNTYYCVRGVLKNDK